MDTTPPKSLGEKGENAASRFLKRKGYRILETNFRTRGGEIDLVALDHGTLCFIEVKTRRSESAGTPEEAVGQKKIRRIVSAATRYRARHNLSTTPVRFDVVALRTGDGDRFDAELTKGAFYEDGWG